MLDCGLATCKATVYDNLIDPAHYTIRHPEIVGTVFVNKGRNKEVEMSGRRPGNELALNGASTAQKPSLALGIKATCKHVQDSGAGQ